MLHDVPLTLRSLLLVLVAAAVVLPACDNDKDDKSSDEDEDDAKAKKDKKEKKEKKKKKKKDKADGDGEGNKADGADGDTSQASDNPALEGRTKKLPWASDDFDNAVPVNDTFETKSKTCNALLNACMACRDRIKASEGDMKLWSKTVTECFNLKTAVLALDAGTRDEKCAAATTKMKGADDCVAGSYSALALVK